MPKEIFTIEGLSDLEDALKELPKATGKNTIRRAMTAAAQPIIDQAADLINVHRVPVTVVGSKIKFTSGNAGKQAFAAALARGASREEAGQAAHQANAAAADSGDTGEVTTSGTMVVGPTKRAFYDFEFGTVRQAPQPFMRPAWDNNKRNTLDILVDRLKVEIEKARQRIIKKQQALLSKMK
jgi:HK97 gp10 family phage protein